MNRKVTQVVIVGVDYTKMYLDEPFVHTISTPTNKESALEQVADLEDLVKEIINDGLIDQEESDQLEWFLYT